MEEKACEICKVVPKRNEFGEITLVEHHVSYLPHKTIIICRSCHAKIHRGKGLEEFKQGPINGVNPAHILYSTKNWIRDSKWRLVRPLTPEELVLKKIMKSREGILNDVGKAEGF